MKDLFLDLQSVVALFSRVWHGSYKHHYMVHLVNLLGDFFFPSAENLVQNSIPLLSKNLSIFSEVYLRAVYAQGSSKLKENKWGGNSLKIYSQALSYHIESKWS